VINGLVQTDYIGEPYDGIEVAEHLGMVLRRDSQLFGL
jgi:hypothetical protein